MTEKTWVYWAGLIIVALSIIGLIRGFAVMALPATLILHMAHAAPWRPLLVGMGVVRLLGPLVLLGVGVYMMRSGSIVKQ